jgi:hypothetical protein
MSESGAAHDLIQAALGHDTNQMAIDIQEDARGAVGAHHAQPAGANPADRADASAAANPPIHDPHWEPPRSYTPDYRGLPYEGKAGADRPYAMPTGPWLNTFKSWASMIDGLHLVLDLGYDAHGELIEGVNLEPKTPRDVFRNTYLCQAMASRLSPNLYAEVKGFTVASLMYHALVKYFSMHVCGVNVLCVSMYWGVG